MNQKGADRPRPPHLAALLGATGPQLAQAFASATEYLRARSPHELLSEAGTTIGSLPAVTHLDKAFFQASFRTGATTEGEDLLAGSGLFFITEHRRLFLDATAGHYQMTWGYNHPRLVEALREALEAGLVWDDHSNIPGDTVKQLARKLVELANAPPASSRPKSQVRAAGKERSAADLESDPEALNRVLLGIATGSVACSTAIKLALNHFRSTRGGGTPLFVALAGNYHGTDLVAQRLRGMWTDYLGHLPVAPIEPNDIESLQQTFARHGSQVAAMFVEPVMMNREAIALDRDYLLEARRLCDEQGALLVFDEIQTGFWTEKFFSAVALGVKPDILVVGKGMTAGFHPLAAVLYRRKYDSLAQYDAISTNGNAPLPAYMALASIALIEEERARIAQVTHHYRKALEALPGEFPRLVSAIHGDGLLVGMKFHTVEAAKEFHRRSLDAGLWLRLHAYHEGHSTALTKFALVLDEETADFFLARVREILSAMSKGVLRQ
jgi:acetylornithine/succinyldiaminopimelate/putrescine aminotransferase